MKISELLSENTVENTWIKIDGKKWEAIPITNWTSAQMKAGALDGAVGISGLPRRKQEAMIESTGRHFLIKNYVEGSSGRKFPLKFFTRHLVSIYKKAMNEAVGKIRSKKVGQYFVEFNGETMKIESEKGHVVDNQDVTEDEYQALTVADLDPLFNEDGNKY